MLEPSCLTHERLQILHENSDKDPEIIFVPKAFFAGGLFSERLILRSKQWWGLHMERTRCLKNVWGMHEYCVLKYSSS